MESLGLAFVVVVFLLLVAIPRVLKMLNIGSGRMDDPVDIIRSGLIDDGDKLLFALGRNNPLQEYPYSVEIHYIFLDSNKTASKCEMSSNIEMGKSIAMVCEPVPMDFYEEKFTCKAWIVKAYYDAWVWENPHAKDDEENAKKWFENKHLRFDGNVYLINKKG